MNLSDFHYDHCLPDYDSRAAFRDSNISISAVISSSCVVLEGLRDTSNCLSSVFPVGHDGQSFFSSEFHSSLPCSILTADINTSPKVADKFSVSNSLDCQSVGFSDGNHFFQSAATEFTTHGEELRVNSDTVHGEFTLEDKSDVNLTVRSHHGDVLIDDSMEGRSHHSNTIFNNEHTLSNKGRLHIYSTGHIDNEFPRNCRFGDTINTPFHPTTNHIDQSSDSQYYYPLHSEPNSTSMEDNCASFTSAGEIEEHCSKHTVNYLTSDGYIQSQSPSHFNNDVIVSRFIHENRDHVNLHSKFSTLHNRSDLTSQNDLDYCSYEYATKSSLNHSSSISEVGEVSNIPNNDCVFRDAWKVVHHQRTKGNRNRLLEPNEETKYVTLDGSEDTRCNQSVHHKYSPESDTESKSNGQYVGQNINFLCTQDDQEFMTNSSYSFHGPTMNDNYIADNSNDEINTKLETTTKSKRKHIETVETLQRHLETLEDRRKNIPPSCSSLNILRQRSHVMEENSGNDDSLTSVDVDHMMCSGVTVAGFKPRAIIRKRSKTTTPSDVKDIEYWQKRRKNNDSARKSRESKKEKEKNFYKRALELEYENLYLQECLNLAETELATLGHPFVPPVFGGQCYS